MSALTGFGSKIKSLCAAIADFFRGLINRGRDFLHEKIPGSGRRLVLVCCAAALVVLVLIIILLTAHSGRGKSGAVSSANASSRTIIPPEELFLPDEPDFIPGILLEREPRETWTVEDAEPYWQDPLKDGEEPWRQHIEKAIDELMERVP